MWHYVALCGIILRRFISSKFGVFLMFSSVALCGAMWHYVALSELFMETKKSYFSQCLLDLCKLCGAMWRYFNIVSHSISSLFHVFIVLLFSWMSRCRIFENLKNAKKQQYKGNHGILFILLYCTL